MNLVENGTEAVVGLISGGSDQILAPLVLGAGLPNLTPGSIVEAVALLAGVGLQLVMPNSLPTFADGLTASGIFGLTRRVGELGGAALQGKPMPPSFSQVGSGYQARVAPASYHAVESPRARGANALTDMGFSRLS